MKAKQIVKSDNPDVRTATNAIQRAAESACKTAIQTDTAIVIVQDGKHVHIKAEELRRQRACQTP